MRILYIIDPIDSLKIYKDSSYLIMQESKVLQHDIFVSEPKDLFLQDFTVQTNAMQIILPIFDEKFQFSGKNPLSWYERKIEKIMALTEFDLVLMRKDPPFDIDYINTTWMLSIAQNAGVKVFNNPQALRDFSEKLAIAQFPQFAPPTLVTNNLALIQKFHEKHKDIIIKPLNGMGGDGVFRVQENGLNLNSIVETLGENGKHTLMAQLFIQEICMGDKRILLLGGKVVPWALVRRPAPGEVRANLAKGGIAKIEKLSNRDLEISNTIAPILWAQGLLIVGIDIIGDYLTEINVTSPTGLREISKFSGINLARMLLESARI